MSQVFKTTFTLLQRAKDQNDSRAWDELVDFYQDYIYSIIKSIKIMDADADGLLKQVTTRMRNELPEFEYKKGEKRFLHWVADVIKYEARMFIRKKKDSITKMDKKQQDAFFAYLNLIKFTETHEIAEEEWKIFISNKAYDMMKYHFTPYALKVFKLYSEGMSAKDIALDLGLSVDTVQKYIGRMKLYLIERIDEIKKDLNF